jgi:cytochrome oxidase Cu insertion factor (SCO1/SenC/PrrC family)
MKKIIVSMLFACALCVCVYAQGTPKAPTTHLKIGDVADFELNDTTGKAVKLSDFKGKKNVVLAFYVLAFTGG